MGKKFKYTGCALLPCSTLLPGLGRHGGGTDLSPSRQAATSDKAHDVTVSRTFPRTHASVGETPKGRWP
jgi:hypothetical protein